MTKPKLQEQYKKWANAPERKLTDYIGKIVYISGGRSLLVASVDGNFRALIGWKTPHGRAVATMYDACYVKEVVRAHDYSVDGEYSKFGRGVYYPNKRQSLT